MSNSPFKAVPERPESLPWYAHPYRFCADDDRYIDYTGVSRREKESLARACLKCPVYYSCLLDYIDTPGDERYGIRAGHVGKG